MHPCYLLQFDIFSLPVYICKVHNFYFLSSVMYVIIVYFSLSVIVCAIFLSTGRIYQKCQCTSSICYMFLIYSCCAISMCHVKFSHKFTNYILRLFFCMLFTTDCAIVNLYRHWAIYWAQFIVIFVVM